MGKNTKSIKCAIEWCDSHQAKKGGGKFDRFCVSHKHKATIDRFLSNLYTRMNQRVQGRGTKNPHLFKGRPIMPRDVFKEWAKNHPDFLKLYKQWVGNRFDRKLTPSVNRLDSSRGYTLDNVEFVTFSQNCMMATSVLKMNNKQRKVIYDLLGVNNGEK